MLPRLAALSCALFMSAATVSAQPQVPAESRLKGIIANKTIRIAHRADARPFSFVNDANEPLGYTVDLCRRLRNRLRSSSGCKT
jgi:glutamate/aspartate transport system substrate-binding protein